MENHLHGRPTARTRSMVALLAAGAALTFVSPIAWTMPVATACCHAPPHWTPSGSEQQFITNVQAMGFYGEGGFAWNILAAGYILCYDVYNYDMQKGLGPDEGLLSRLLSDSRIGPDRLSSATSDQLREVMRLATVDLCPPDRF